ncbi:MAG: hypothetical protein AAGB32_02770 [Pseudomonadota bacterium]
MKFLIILAFVLFTPLTAEAVSKRVSSPNVSKGLAMDNRGSFASDETGNDDFRHNLQFKYGITDNFRISVDTDYRKRGGSDAEFSNSDIEFRYKFIREENVGVSYSGGYEFNHSGDADGVFTSFQGEYKLGPWKHQANIGIDADVGDEAASGFNYDFRSGHYYKLQEIELGLEYFADFGNWKDGNRFEEQEHHLGPVVNFNIPVGEKKIKAVLGYAAGLTDASDDHIFKYEFGYKF